MTTSENSVGHLNQAGQNLGRILIASYFVAVALGMISGTDMTVLAQQAIPDPYAGYVSNGAVFVLAYLVLMGMWLRPAALLLSLALFWSSYIVHLGVSASGEITGFWRDLALIGALFLTYAQTGPRAIKRRAMLRWTPKTRRIDPHKYVAPRRVTATQPVRAMITPIAPAIAARDAKAMVTQTSEDFVENIFADFDEAEAV